MVILENIKMFSEKRQTSRFTVAKSVIIQEDKIYSTTFVAGHAEK